MKKMRNCEQELADQLDAYIDRPAEIEGSQPEPTASPIVDVLHLSAAAVEPDPAFVERLSARLRREWAPSSSWRRRWMPNMVWIKQVLEGGMTMKKGLALAAAAAALILAIVLPLALDGDQGRMPLPRLVHASGPSGESVLSGLLSGAELTLEAELPGAPSEVPVYVAQSHIPATREEALAWARDFGFTDAQIYRDPRETETLFIRTGDDRQLTFRRHGPMAEIHYGDAAAAAREGTPRPFEQAAEAAEAFLQEHNMLPDEYRVQEVEDFAPSAESPFQMVEIVLLQDGRPVVGYHATMHVSVNPASEVTYAALNPLTIEESHVYPIKSAQEAYAALSDGETGRPFRLDVDRSAPDALDIRHYRPEPPTYSVGDVVTVTGWVQALVAEDGSDVYAFLTARDGVTYDLTGPRLTELTDVGYNDLRVTGTLVAQSGAQRWQLALSDWEIVPPQKIQCLVGVFVRDEGEAWIEIDEDAVPPVASDLPESGRYRLPGAPDELEDGEQVEICTDAWPATGDDVDWRSITTPPTSEQTPASGSSSSMVVVEAVEVVEGAAPTAPPPPTPTPLPRTHVVQEGETLRMIADRYSVTVDALLAANDGLDASQLSAGQLLFIPETSQPVTEPQPEPAATSPPASPPSSPWGELPFELGQQVEITGVVYATIYVDGDMRRTVVHLSTPTLPSYPLIGPPELLEEIAEHHRLHVRVWGEVVAAGEEWRPMEHAIQVERFEKLWPEEQLQGFLGHIEPETLDGRQVAVFTDHETEQRYVVAQSLERENFLTPGQDPLLDFEQIFVAGGVRPGATFAGLPLLRLTRSRHGRETEGATSADEFAVYVGPDVINEAERRTSELHGAFVVDRVELAYYYEPQPGYVVRSEDGPPPTPEPPTETVVQPVWVFYGHNADGSVRFTAYVQAVKEDHVVRADAEVYAEAHDVPLDEAMRRLKQQDPVGEINAVLQEQETDVFGGLWIQHEPEYQVIVLVTGDAADRDHIRRRYVQGGPLEETVEIREAQATLAELEAAQAETLRILEEIGSRADTGVDVRENCVSLYVADSEALRAKLEAAGLTLPEPVCVEATGPYTEAPPLDPPPGVVFPRQHPPEGLRAEMTALLIGELFEDDGCLRVGDENMSHLIIWPYDHTVTAAEDGTLQVRDGSGAVVAQVGDVVRMGGGETRSPGSATPTEIPARCTGPYWIAGSQIEGINLQELPDHPDITPLLRALRTQGYAREEPEESQSQAAFLQPEPGIAYRLDEHSWLHLHLFPDEKVAQVRADAIAHQMPHPTIDWVAPPHFYRCGRVIALYLGDNEDVEAVLDESLRGPEHCQLIAGPPSEASTSTPAPLESLTIVTAAGDAAGARQRASRSADRRRPGHRAAVGLGPVGADTALDHLDTEGR